MPNSSEARLDIDEDVNEARTFSQVKNSRFIELKDDSGLRRRLEFTITEFQGWDAG